MELMGSTKELHGRPVVQELVSGWWNEFAWYRHVVGLLSAALTTACIVSLTISDVKFWFIRTNLAQQENKKKIGRKKGQSGMVGNSEYIYPSIHSITPRQREEGKERQSQCGGKVNWPDYQIHYVAALRWSAWMPPVLLPWHPADFVSRRSPCWRPQDTASAGTPPPVAPPENCVTEMTFLGGKSKIPCHRRRKTTNKNAYIHCLNTVPTL